MQLILTIDDSSAQAPEKVGSHRRMHLIRQGQSLVVGREAAHCDILIEHDAILSAAHFRVSCGPDGCTLVDLQSRHGTLINGVRILEAVLAHGDRIVAGATRFEVQLTETVVRSDSQTATLKSPLAKVRAVSEEDTDLEKDAAQNPRPPRDHMRLMLQIIEQPSSVSDRTVFNRVFTTILPGEVMTIGRVPEKSHIAFPNDVEISGAHVELSCDRQECRLRDLNSTNGTFLNGEPMYNLLLRDGDEIRLGRTHLIVYLKSPTRSGDQGPRQTLADIGLRPGLKKQAETRANAFRIVNTTSFPMAPLTGRIRFPRHSLTLIVKGTFQWKLGERMVPLEEQPFATGDVPFDDGDDHSKPPRYESDFAFFKPSADILLAGHCYAPKAQPVRRLKVGLKVGSHSSALDVFGKRYWKKERGQWTTTEPEPFATLELGYQHSYGGEGCDANPFGVGFHTARHRRSDVPLPLPLIESPDAPMRAPDSVVEPAGFGPVGKWYGRRRAQLGTYDKAWEEKRWPWFPADFSWEHDNAAPASLQVAGFLKGDEEIILQNLHPDHAEYRTSLPGIRIRCFVNPLGKEFREVPVQLDTLSVDADKEHVVILWRGNTDVASEECQDIRHVFILSQPLEDEPWSVNECHARLLDELSRRDAEFNPPPEVLPKDAEESALAEGEFTAEGVTAGAEETAAQEANRKFEEELAILKTRVRDAQIAAGADPQQFDQQVEAETARLVHEWGLDGEVPPPDLESRIEAELFRLRKQVHTTQVAAGLNPDPVPEPQGAVAEPSEDTSDWTRERVIKHHADGGDFAGEILASLDLSDLDLSGAVFSAAVLQGTKFVRCRLCDTKFDLANLAGTDLTEAVLDNAVLDNADLTGAVMHLVQLNGAHAHGAIFANTWLTGASLCGADATGAYFTEADLTGASLKSAKLDSADFSEARLVQADMRECSLIEAVLNSVSARGAILDRSDLTRARASGADFSGVRFHAFVANGSIWENATLKAADFSYAKLHGANFIKANLEGATLFAADMSGARLNKASLGQAVMTDVKLFEASLQEANLTKADLSRSNLYGAEVFGAVWEDACLESVNLKMTKMANQEKA